MHPSIQTFWVCKDQIGQTEEGCSAALVEYGSHTLVASVLLIGFNLQSCDYHLFLRLYFKMYFSCPWRWLRCGGKVFSCYNCLSEEVLLKGSWDFVSVKQFVPSYPYLSYFIVWPLLPGDAWRLLVIVVSDDLTSPCMWLKSF